MAIVRTFGGSPPPAKLYKQPPSSRSAQLRNKPPNRRIKTRYLIHPRNRELQRPSRRRIAITHVLRVSPIDPLQYPVAVDAFNANERVAMKGKPPADRPSDVGADVRPLTTNDGIGQIWQR